MSRPAEEIRADLARAARSSLDDLANWPALSLRLIDDVASLLADRERLSAELADARAWRDKWEDRTGQAVSMWLDVKARAVAAERALEAVRAGLKPLADALLSMRFSKYRDQAGWAWLNAEGIGAKLAALSAASPTTSNDRETREVVDEYVRLHRPMEPPAAASDEPARCLHGNAAAQTYACGCEPARCGCPTNEAGDIRCHNCLERVNVKCWKCGTPRGEGRCPNPIPGPAASGTPETTR